MLLTKPNRLSVNDSMREIQVHGTKAFPFQGYLNGVKNVEGEGWHWHSEAELVLVLEDRVQCGVNGEQFEIKKGEGLFINSGSLHMAGIKDSPFPLCFCRNSFQEMIRGFYIGNTWSRL